MSNILKDVDTVAVDALIKSVQVKTYKIMGGVDIKNFIFHPVANKALSDFQKNVYKAEMGEPFLFHDKLYIKIPFMTHAPPNLEIRKALFQKIPIE